MFPLICQLRHMKEKMYVVKIPASVHKIIKSLTMKTGMKLGAWAAMKLLEAAKQERAK